MWVSVSVYACIVPQNVLSKTGQYIYHSHKISNNRGGAKDRGRGSEKKFNCSLFCTYPRLVNATIVLLPQMVYSKIHFQPQLWCIHFKMTSKEGTPRIIWSIAIGLPLPLLLQLLYYGAVEKTRHCAAINEWAACYSYYYCCCLRFVHSASSCCVYNLNWLLVSCTQ